MEKLDGILLSGLDFKPLKMGDLLYHEGPLLSHFVDEENPLTGSGFDEKGFEDYALELKGNISAYRSTLNRLRRGLVKKVAL